MLILKVTIKSLYCSFSTKTQYSRSSHQRCSIRKGVLRNFTKFRGKHLCQSLFFNRVADLRPITLSKERLAQVFSCEFCENSKNTLFAEHLRATASVTLSSFILGVLGKRCEEKGAEGSLNKWNQEKFIKIF